MEQDGCLSDSDVLQEVDALNGGTQTTRPSLWTCALTGYNGSGGDTLQNITGSC